jgi:hypothetical protein
MSLKKQAVGVQSGFSIPSGTKRDVKVTSYVAQAYGSAQRGQQAGNYNKIVIHPTYLKPFRKIRSDTLVYMDEWTLPWLADMNVLPSKQVLDFGAFFRKKKSQWDTCLDNLSNQYPDEIQDEARNRLTNDSTGESLFRMSDYLGKEDFLNKFSMTMRFIPLSDADDLDLRVHVGEQEAASIQRQVRADMEQELTDTHTELCLRIKEHVTHMRDILSSENPRIFDCMLDGVRQLADTIPALNFTGDQELNTIAEQIRTELSPNSILLRDSEYEREVVSTKADDILRKLGTLYAS